MIFDYIQTTEEQKDILDIARQICEKELLPQVPELDRTGTYPEMWQRSSLMPACTPLRFRNNTAAWASAMRPISFWRRPWVIMMPGSASLSMPAVWAPNVFSWAEQRHKSNSRPTSCSMARRLPSV